MTGQALSMRNMPRNAREIPNIDLAKLHEGSAIRAGVQHETIGRLAELMGRDPVPHRHDDCLQIHFIETGHFDLVLDDVRCRGIGPAVFLEQDTYVIFDDVLVPHERMFIDCDLDIYNGLRAAGWAANVFQQTSTRAASVPQVLEPILTVSSAPRTRP